MAENRFTDPLQALAYYTECAFATAEGARLKKSTPKREQARFDSLANGMFENLKLIINDPIHRANLRIHINRLSLRRLRVKFEAEEKTTPMVLCPLCEFTNERENSLTAIMNGVHYYRCNNCNGSFVIP